MRMTKKAIIRRGIVTAIEGVIVAAGVLGGMALIGGAVELICRLGGF